MNIRSAEFVTSAAQPHQFLKRPIPHIVFVGKSNVGKSSLLNGLLNRKNLAKTSASPGKTRLVNYFLINDNFFFVDLPGYGYAKVSKKEKASWQELIESYLYDNPLLASLIWLVDIRHPLGKNDQFMLEWLQTQPFPFQLVLTKADKLSKNETYKQIHALSKACGIRPQSCIATSAAKGQGMAELWRSIEDAIQIKSEELKDRA